MASQRDVKNKIASVKNIQKITRAMEMVAAARGARAEQRIEALRPYADALRRMTRQARRRPPAREAARVRALLREHESEQAVALLLVTGDRGLAGTWTAGELPSARIASITYFRFWPTATFSYGFDLEATSNTFENA